MNEDTQALDLDALMPEVRLVKLKGKTYEVQPPSLKVLPQLSRKLDKLSKLENTDDPEQVADALEELSATIRLVMPTLPEEIELNIEQSTALIQLIMDMVTPPEQKALKKEGLLPDAQKKTDSVS